MAITTVETMKEGLRTVYLPVIISQINEKSGPVFNALEKRTEQATPNEFIFTVKYGRHGGIGAAGEIGPLPTPGARKYRQGRVSVKNLYGKIELTDKIIEGTQNNKAAFAEELTTQIEDITKDLRDMTARNFCGDHTGTIVTVKTAITTASDTVAIEGNIESLYEGQIIDILTPAATPVYKAQKLQIMNVDRVAGTITLSGTTLAAVGDAITLSGAYGNELTGLKDVLKLDTELYGIDRSAAKWFNPIFLDKATGGTPAPFDSLWMADAITKVKNRTGEKPKFLVCSDGVEKAYVQAEQDYKRNIKTMEVDGGYETLSYAGIPVVADMYFMPNSMALLTIDNWKLAQISEWHWLDKGGSRMQLADNAPIWSASLAKYCELVCTKPGGNALITGIEEVAA
jgi:hypothetical protein